MDLHNSTIDTQLNHRTIRRFEDKPVAEDVLKQIFAVANRTPSSLGMQMASIIRVTDPSIRARLTEIGEQPYVGKAPVYLLFIADAHRNAGLLAEAGQRPQDAASVRNFIQGFTDACLMAQNVCVAAESLGLGVNYLGSVLNDAQGVIDALQLPKYTMPVVGMTLGWPAEEPQLKPRIPVGLRVMENGYHAPENWHEALAAYDAEMKNYYDLRSPNAPLPAFSAQVVARNPNMRDLRDETLLVARAQGFEV